MTSSDSAALTTPPQRQTTLGACPHDCPDTCSLVAESENFGPIQRVIHVRGNPAHAATAGVLCQKVSRYPERLYHPKRLLTPLKRVGPKGQGQFEAVSWEHALQDIAARLQRVIAKHGASAVQPYSYAGTMGQVQGEGMAARFFHSLGAATLERTICAEAGARGYAMTVGASKGLSVPQFEHSRLIIIWGSNPIASSVHFWRVAHMAKRHGTKLICIDPRKSETAAKCDQHIALLPGTDAALALAIMHELITHDWLDHAYIQDHTEGFDALRAHALTFPPERAAAICGIDADVIRQLAHDYASLTPAAIRMNYGLQRVRGGGNAVRAIAALPALTGAWRSPYGGVLLSQSGTVRLDTAAVQRPDLRPASATPARSSNMSTIGAELCAPHSAIHALIVYNSNPVAIAPNSHLVRQGFARDDVFTVVLEHFQTDTADYADYVLPATMQMEHWDIHNAYGHSDILLNRPAVPAPGQCLPNAEIFRRLAAAMGLPQAAFSLSDEAMCRLALGTFDQASSPQSADAIWQTLLDQGFYPTPQAAAPFAQGGFATANGKCQLAQPVPDYLPNYETPGSNARFPLAFITPPSRHFLNTTFANIDSLQRQAAQPTLEIHPDDAAARHIAPGDSVRVFNARGSILCRAEVGTPAHAAARKGVVNALGIWWHKDSPGGNNINCLTSDQLTDIGAGPVFYDCLVEVVRA